MTLQIVANPTAYMKAMMVATPVPITEMMSLQPVSGLVAPALQWIICHCCSSGKSRNIIDPFRIHSKLLHRCFS